MARPRHVITWDAATDTGQAPDGARYGLNSETVRGEPPQWWATCGTCNGREVGQSHDKWPTKARARADAEAHHHARHA